MHSTIQSAKSYSAAFAVMVEMIRVTTSEFQKSFGTISDVALQGPITILKWGRDHLVVLAADEYQRLKQRERRVCQVVCVSRIAYVSQLRTIVRLIMNSDPPHA